MCLAIIVASLDKKFQDTEGNESSSPIEKVTFLESASLIGLLLYVNVAKS
jgi:hypothetical protein